MKSAMLALLAVTNFSFAAQWSLLGDNDFGTFFVDPASIKRTRGILQAQILLNWRQPQLLHGHEKNYASEISTAYLDCGSHKIGFGSRSMYPRPDGLGTAIFSPYLAFSDIKLQNTVPGSTGALMMKAICERR